MRVKKFKSEDFVKMVSISAEARCIGVVKNTKKYKKIILIKKKIEFINNKFHSLQRKYYRMKVIIKVCL